MFQKMAGYKHHSIIPCVSTVGTQSDGRCQVPSAHAVHSAYLQNFFDRLSVHTYYLVLRFVLTSYHPVTQFYLPYKSMDYTMLYTKRLLIGQCFSTICIMLLRMITKYSLSKKPRKGSQS